MDEISSLIDRTKRILDDTEKFDLEINYRSINVDVIKRFMEEDKLSQIKHYSTDYFTYHVLIIQENYTESKQLVPCFIVYFLSLNLNLSV